jgi:hypothetical protein
MKLDGFQHWNQYLINAFYKYSIDRCVLPKTDRQQQVILYGPVSNVYEVNQKYQLTNALIQQKLSGFSTTIMISYSPEDSIISHRLANRLIDDGLSVSINSDSFETIDKSSCIILCISENYFQNQSCEKEVKYAEQIGKNLIPVKVEYYQPIEWLKTCIEKQSYFQLYGSENQFNFEYDRLLLKIISSFKQTSNKYNLESFFLLTFEQKKLRYENNVKKIMMKFNKEKEFQLKENQYHIYVYQGKKFYMNHFSFILIFIDTTVNLDNQSKIDFTLGIISYREYLDRLKNLKMILNIPPFTFTGDINDAIFPCLKQVLQDSRQMNYSTGIESDCIPLTNRKQQIRSIDKPKINSERSSIVSHISNNNNRSKKVNRRKPRKFIWKGPTGSASFTKNEKLEFQSKFAEQMTKNIEEFEKYCVEHEHSFTSSENRRIQVYSTVIFGPSPFPNIPSIEPVKRLRIDNQKYLPLKFPWNGVFDTEIPTVKRKDPSIFFFFEVLKSSEKH